MPCSGDGTGGYCARACAASGRRPGRVSAAGHLRFGAVCQGGVGRRQSRQRRFCGNRHAAVAYAQARALRGGHHHPRQAAADGGVPAHDAKARVGDDRARVSRRDRAVRRCPFGRPDECGADHSPAADHYECRAAGTFRALGHPQGGHAAVDPSCHRCAGCGADCDPPGAGLRPAALSARQPLRARRARSGCTVAARTTS